jgi:prepilin-type N-terminal cleavage/methylation domain-containing protein
MRCRNTNGTRRGFSLVELVAVMIAGSVLMSVTIAAVVALQRADQRFSRHANERTTIGRLFDRLRRDVRAASRVSWDAGANRLALTMPTGGRIVYDLEDRRWMRRTSDEAEGALQLAGVYRAPAGFTCLVTPAIAAEGSLVRMTWAATSQPHDPRRRARPPVELVAEVGRDLTLLTE